MSQSTVQALVQSPSERGGAGRKEEKVLLAGLAMRKRRGEEGVRERRRER